MVCVNWDDVERLRAGRPLAELLELLEITPRTWRRWRASSNMPRPAWLLLKLLAGELEALGGPAWSGWRLVRGTLYDPADVGHAPGTVRAWHWTQQALQELRARENRYLPAALPANVKLLHPDRQRPGHAITRRLHARIESDSERS